MKTGILSVLDPASGLPPCPHAYSFLRQEKRLRVGQFHNTDETVDIYYCVRCLDYREKVTNTVVKHGQ